MSIGGRALGGTQLQRPERAQNVKHRLGAVRTAGAERCDQQAGQRRAGASCHIEDDRAQADRIGQVLSRHNVADDRRARRLLKRLDDGHAEGRDIDMPGLDLTGKNEQRQRREHRSVNDLSNQNLSLA